MRSISHLCLFLFFAFSLMGMPLSAHATDAASTPSEESASSDDDLFAVHQDEGEYRFEIPEALLGRDMVILSRIARTAQGHGWGGDRLDQQQLVRWERRGDRILLRGVSYENAADDDLPVYRAVENSNFEPIIHAFPIESEDAGTVTIDVTDFYLQDLRLFGLSPAEREEYQIRGFDRDRSFIESIQSFPENIEVRKVVTYEADNPPSQSRTGSLSLEINHSMILLPEEPMEPRLYDERVGMISVEQTDYGHEAQQTKTQQYVTRFRLEPSDMEAFEAGELVEPKEPIVFYIDPATPEQWRPYFKEGVEEWNAAFEEAGFKNAVEARMAPTDDPDFSLLDARHSVIRYVANPIHSANAGPDVIDPRSGETIRAHMNMYHNVMKRLHWWSLTQTGPRNDAVQNLHLPVEEMGEYLRYVVSHEMAHALGYPHNQKGNSAYPVDSLRSPAFTEEWGNSSSVVGRTRFNYVAQPGDGDVRVHRAVGPYDKWAVKWAYRPIPEAESAEDERPILDEWVRERADDPTYRFGYGNDFDPYQQTESIGREWVEASELGMENLRRVVPNLVDWLAVEGDNYFEVMQRYMQVFAQWNRFITRVTSAIGGLEEELKVHGQDGPLYHELDPEDQRRSFEFLDEHVFQTPHWLLDQELLRKFEHVGAVERVRWYQVNAVNQLLDVDRFERMIEQQAFNDEAYSVAELLDDLRASLWSELDEGGAIDTYRRNLQRGYLERVEHLLTEASGEAPPPPGDYRPDIDRDAFDSVELRTEFHIQQSDVRPLLREQLTLLHDAIGEALETVEHRETRAHLDAAQTKIERLL